MSAYQGLAQSFKNKLINPDFGLWQRGTTLAVTTGQAKYLADRWKLSVGGTSAAATYNQQPFTLGQTAVPGEPKYYAQVVVSNGGDATNGDIDFGQFIEGVRTFAGKKVTLSFWAWAAAGTPKVAVELGQFFGSGGSPSPQFNTSGGFVTLSATPQKFSITVTLSSISGKAMGTTANTDALVVTFWMSAGSTYASRASAIGIQTGTFNFANIQLEAGDTATDFEVRPVGAELAMAQRYYEKSFPVDFTPANGASAVSFAETADLTWFTGITNNTNANRGTNSYSFKATKRISGFSLTAYGNNTSLWNLIDTAAADSWTAPLLGAGNATIHGFTASANPGASGRTFAVGGHWTADADY